MINPIYQANLVALAAKLKVPNSPRISEQHLRIAQLEFLNEDSEQLASVEGTHMNLGGRLFFEQFVRQGLAIGHLKNPLMQQAMADHFAELWHAPLPTGRTLIDAIRAPEHEYIRYVLKT